MSSFVCMPILATYLACMPSCAHPPASIMCSLSSSLCSQPFPFSSNLCEAGILRPLLSPKPPPPFPAPQGPLLNPFPPPTCLHHPSPRASAPFPSWCHWPPPPSSPCLSSLLHSVGMHCRCWRLCLAHGTTPPLSSGHGGCCGHPC